VYKNADQQPALVALRMPRALEARLRDEAAESGRTLTDLLLQSLVMRWEHPTAAADLVETEAQLATLTRQYVALERKSTRLTQQRRSQAATDKKERRRLTEELAMAEAHMRLMHEQLTVFTAENPELAEKNARRYANVRQEENRRRLAELREEMDDRMAELTGRAHASPVPVMELIKLCHPDRWSNGQPATELANELMVRLNAMRRSSR
jgi:hypothetical protein